MISCRSNYPAAHVKQQQTGFVDDCAENHAGDDVALGIELGSGEN
jgi:hypothetical protein